jgi:hypothetical protein
MSAQPDPQRERRRLGPRIGPQVREIDRAAFDDPVERWKQSVRTSLQSHKHTPDQAVLRLEVTFGFFAVAAAIGSAKGTAGVISTLVVLVSTVFVHELARALVARSLGRSSRICMSAVGGETTLSGPPLVGLASILVTVAGSVANGLLALGAVAIVRRGVGADVAPVLRLFALTNGTWSVAQLLPLPSFHVGSVLSKRLTPTLRFAQAASSAVWVLAIGFRAIGQGFPPAIVGLCVFASTGCIRALREAYREMHDLHAGLESVVGDARRALSSGESALAFEISGRGLARALSVRYREALWRTAAWAGIGKRDPLLAHDALLHLPAGAVDLYLLGSYLGCCNRLDEAIDLLQQGRRAGQGTPECTRLLADLLFRRGDSDAVLALARGEDGTLSPEDREAIEVAVASLQSA